MISGNAAPVGPDEGGEGHLRLDDHVPHRLAAAAEAASRLVARAHEARFGLSAVEWRLLAWMADHASAGPAQIAAGAAIERRAAGAALRALARRELVAPAAQGELSLTDAGLALHARVAPLVLAYEAALLSGLSPGEVTALKRLLTRLEDAADRLTGAPDAAAEPAGDD